MKFLVDHEEESWNLEGCNKNKSGRNGYFKRGYKLK